MMFFIAALTVIAMFYLALPREVLFSYDPKIAVTLFFIIFIYYGIKIALYIFIKSKRDSEISKNSNGLLFIKNFNVIDISIKCICWLIIISLIYFSVLRNLMICNLNLLDGISKIYH